MAESSEEFRHDIAKEMRAKLAEREAKLKELESQTIDEEVKEATRKEIMEDFYKEIEEMKSRPGYKEAAQEHQDQIKAKIKEMLKPEDEILLEELKNAKTVEKRVQLFVTLTDKIPLDALAGIIPYYGDFGMSIISTIFLVYQGKKIGLSGKDIGKIVGYQVIDALIGVVGLTDIVGDIADYFFKANKYSAKYFTRKVEELERQAREKGIDPKKIEEMELALESEGKKQEAIGQIASEFKKRKKKNRKKGEK